MEEKCFLYDECNHCDCGQFCLRRYKLERFYSNALISRAQRIHIPLSPDSDGTDLAKFKQLSNIEKDIVNFVEQGQHLYIHSNNCGNGKSSWALRLAQAYLNEVWPSLDSEETPVLFISVPRYLLAIKDNITVKSDYVQHIKDRVLTADIVIWDDIAAKTGSDFEVNNLFSIIDTRIAMGKTNIYTTNLNPIEMHKALGDRLASRVCNSSIDIQFDGADKRQFSVSYDK